MTRLACCSLLISVLAFGSTAVAARPDAAALAPPAASAAPFAIGEKLVYEVEWNPPWYLFFLPVMHAGEAELTLAELTEYEGKRALRIVFNARSSGTLVKLAGVKIDDTFEFFTDPETFCTFMVKKKLREGKRKRDITVVYLPESRRLHMHEVDVGVSPPQVKRDEYKDNVPPCVKDVFSGLYWMRTQELAPGSRQGSVVGDNDRIKEVEVRVREREVVLTPAGRYDTLKMETVALIGGLFKGGGQFHLWLSADRRKVPVQFEAKVSLGRVSGKLKQLEGTVP